MHIMKALEKEVLYVPGILCTDCTFNSPVQWGTQVLQYIKSINKMKAGNQLFMALKHFMMKERLSLEMNFWRKINEHIS